MPVADVSTLDSALVIGSFLRKDHPLLAQRLRRAVRHYANVSRIHVAREDWLMSIDAEAIVAPDAMVATLAAVLAALARSQSATVSAECAALVASAAASDEAERIAQSLVSGEKRAVFLGNLAVQHPQYAALHVLGLEIARLAQASFGVIGEAANSVGGYLAGALPKSGSNVRDMIDSRLKAYVVLGAELELDVADGAAARAALDAAASVIYLGSFAGKAPEYADVMLPIAPFSETSGSFVNTEGRLQSFNAAAKPLGETRPAWKVLRVLGNLLGLQGFEQASSEDALAEVLATGELRARLGNAVADVTPYALPAATGLQRVADVPIHFADPLVRRSVPLQKTRDSALPTARMNSAQLRELGVEEGAPVAVRSALGEVILKAKLDDSLPSGAVRVSAAHASTVALGPLFGELTVERA